VGPYLEDFSVQAVQSEYLVTENQPLTVTYKLVNDSKNIVYYPNHGGDGPFWLLQKRMDGNWIVAYDPVFPDILLPPHRIYPQERIPVTMRLEPFEWDATLHPPYRKVEPAWNGGDIEGTYRVGVVVFTVWTKKRHGDGTTPEDIMIDAYTKRWVMQKDTIFICLFSLLLFACDSSTGPPLNPELAKMEIHYSKGGGWIDTSELHIRDRLVEAHHIRHASSDTIASNSMVLDRSDQRKIATLFLSFSDYESDYEPEPWYIDGNWYTIILVYEGVADTVSVYGPEDANIPKGLNSIIQEMESLWQAMFE
jgi:hypothetical protein